MRDPPFPARLGSTEWMPLCYFVTQICILYLYLYSECHPSPHMRGPRSTSGNRLIGYHPDPPGLKRKQALFSVSTPSIFASEFHVFNRFHIEFNNQLKFLYFETQLLSAPLHLRLNASGGVDLNSELRIGRGRLVFIGGGA